ncbi:MAG: adenylate/guanylate cyclase domain-containing protein [Arenicellales bacterium]|nr:adenylate/guanylate cyclase domain-containing protein [Arenicellales bacterium]
MANEIREWLSKLGLSEHIDVFVANAIDLELLPHLTNEDLKELGITKLGERKKLLLATKQLQSGGKAASDAPSASRGEAERRQLTVMFVDLVGSTALSGRLDPEEMREIITVYQNTVAGVVTRFDGHIARYMGDGVLCYFGWPRAHEDDAERAVHASLSIMEALLTLRLPDGEAMAGRIGIATGPVVVGDLIGEGSAQEEAVVGETPNLAARLQHVAIPGQIVVSESTQRLLGGAFDLNDLGAKALKGVAEPERVFAVVGARALETRFEARADGGLTPMVGRDLELNLLLEHWAQAKAGEGQGVLIIGEAGIGKSRLAQALLDSVAEEQLTRIRYQCSPYHTDSAFWPVIQQLKRTADLSAGQPIANQLNNLENLIGQAVEEPTAIAPFIASLLGLDGEQRYGRLELGAHALRTQTIAALSKQFLGLATKQPVLLLLEDAHWIDPSTLELIAMDLDQITKTRALLVLTSRPENQPELAAHPNVTRLTLNRLGRAGAEAMVARLAVNRKLPIETISVIIARTDGVPLFVEELTKAVLETGETGETNVPGSLHDSLMARLDRIPEVKEIAQICACVGRTFDYRVVAFLSDRPDLELQSALQKLIEAELIFGRGVPPDASYTFKHALVQDAAYQSLLKTKRAELHARIAKVFDEQFTDIASDQPELVAHHYTEAGLAEPAIENWLRAGEQAAARYAHPEAVAHLRRGLSLINEIGDLALRLRREIDLQYALGVSLHTTKGWPAPEVGAVYARAEELCSTVGDTATLYPVLIGRWYFHIVRGDIEHAQELAQRCYTMARNDGDPDYLFAAHHVLCGICWAGDFNSSCEHFDAALTLEEKVSSSLTSLIGADLRVFVRAFGCHSLWHVGCLDRAVAVSDESITRARDADDSFTLAIALDYAAMLHQFRRDRRRAQSLAAEAIALCTEHHIAYYGAWARIILGWTMIAAGDQNDGLTKLRKGLADIEATGAALRMPYYLSLLADAEARVGRPEDGLATIDRAIAIANANGEHWRDADLYRVRGQLLSATGNLDEAELALWEALAIARGQGANALELQAALDLARLLCDVGRTADAHDLLAPVYAAFNEGFEAPDLKDANALLSELS